MNRPLSYAAMIGSFCLSFAIVIGGCARTATGGKGGAWCEIERPLRLSEATISVMTRAELEAAVTHNEHGERECGWRPSR
uniref:Lipoprotein n=1 Tax=Bosea sp. NBC_00436 TaxID=2969620 RepID=A0A9E8CTC8_9HYPH